MHLAHKKKKNKTTKTPISSVTLFLLLFSSMQASSIPFKKNWSYINFRIYLKLQDDNTGKYTETYMEKTNKP